MNKKYRLKPYANVGFHHLIDKEKWDKLAEEPALDVEFLGDIFGESALISPIGVDKTPTNTVVVSRSDLYIVRDSITNNAKPDNTVIKEKTYTKDELYKTATLVMQGIENEDEAVSASIILAKFLNKLN